MFLIVTILQVKNRVYFQCLLRQDNQYSSLYLLYKGANDIRAYPLPLDKLLDLWATLVRSERFGVLRCYLDVGVGCGGSPLACETAKARLKTLGRRCELDLRGRKKTSL